MKYLDKKFSSPANSRAFVDNWSAIFGEPEQPAEGERVLTVHNSWPATEDNATHRIAIAPVSDE